MSDRSCQEESQWVRELKSGDVRAFEELFRVYGKRLYHFSLGLLKSKPVAEEIVQEVFFKVWQLRANLDPDLSFNAYLFKIAYRQITERFRKISLERRYLAEISAEAIPFTDELNERNNYHSLLQLVEKSIKKLPPRQKEIFLLRRAEGLSVAQIAEKLEIAPKTVEHHLTEAQKSIKACLSGDHIAGMLFFCLFVHQAGQDVNNGSTRRIVEQRGSKSTNVSYTAPDRITGETNQLTPGPSLHQERGD